MASEVVIRAGTKADRKRLAEIFLAARRHAFVWIPPDSFRLSDFARETHGETILVAESGGEILGFAALWEPDAFLHHLYVDPAMHRRGIGMTLMRAVRALCDRPLELKCQTGNRAAIRFYEKLGFTRGETGVSEMGPWVRYRAPD
jgi:ribosomal protein S18 acetylase RimI-like enzyme